MTRSIEIYQPPTQDFNVTVDRVAEAELNGGSTDFNLIESAPEAQHPASYVDSTVTELGTELAQVTAAVEKFGRDLPPTHRQLDAGSKKAPNFVKRRVMTGAALAATALTIAGGGLAATGNLEKVAGALVESPADLKKDAATDAKILKTLHDRGLVKPN
ncbi:MAG: hypothetical protein ACR2FM_05170 [Candidatus Saccharimonadales bacterium]